jgi:hypothetical protein
MPARLAALRTADHAILSVIGTSTRQLFTMPRNNQVFGFIQRQYSRKVSKRLLVL